MEGEAYSVYLVSGSLDNGGMHKAGIWPETTDNLAEAYELVRRDGAVCFDGIGPSAKEAVELGHKIFSHRVRSIPEAARVFVGGEMDRYDQPDHTKPLKPHTDGFAYGDLFPDYIMLSCVNASAQGGESFLVDGYAVLENLAAGNLELMNNLQTIAVDQTEEDMQVSHSPIVQYNSAHRKLLRRNFSQKPLRSSQQPERDQAMIEIWIRAVDAAGDEAPRFKVAPGQVLIVDNYRVLHAREGYADVNRMMWRVWVWTDECLGVPDMPLHSDSRYALRD